MKNDEQCWKNQSTRDLGVGGDLASCTCGLNALLRVARAAETYLDNEGSLTEGWYRDFREELKEALKELPEGLLEAAK